MDFNALAGSCDGYVCALFAAVVALPVFLAIPALVVAPVFRSSSASRMPADVANGNQTVCWIPVRQNEPLVWGMAPLLN